MAKDTAIRTGGPKCRPTINLMRPTYYRARCDLSRAAPRGNSGLRLRQGKLGLAVMAQPEPFNERLDVLALCHERFCIAFLTGYRLDQQNRVEISDARIFTDDSGRARAISPGRCYFAVGLPPLIFRQVPAGT